METVERVMFISKLVLFSKQGVLQSFESILKLSLLVHNPSHHLQRVGTDDGIRSLEGSCQTTLRQVLSFLFVVFEGCDNVLKAGQSSCGKSKSKSGREEGHR